MDIFIQQKMPERLHELRLRIETAAQDAEGEEAGLAKIALDIGYKKASRICRNVMCCTQPAYGKPGEKASFCGEHKAAAHWCAVHHHASEWAARIHGPIEADRNAIVPLTQPIFVFHPHPVVHRQPWAQTEVVLRVHAVVIHKGADRGRGGDATLIPWIA